MGRSSSEIGATVSEGDAQFRARRAVEVVYHSYLTGLILTTVSRRSGADAAAFVFRTFRRQHLEKFLASLAKLGLSTLPHAVACAPYHDLSNRLGGVRVEYMCESDRKAWVRYLPPRWIYEGAAVTRPQGRRVGEQALCYVRASPFAAG